MCSPNRKRKVVNLNSSGIYLEVNMSTQARGFQRMWKVIRTSSPVLFQKVEVKKLFLIFLRHFCFLVLGLLLIYWLPVVPQSISRSWGHWMNGQSGNLKVGTENSWSLFYCAFSLIYFLSVDYFYLAFFHLWVLIRSFSSFQATEIFNFTQDDLMTEDILILDCHSDIFVWVGKQVDSKTRSQALNIGTVYIIFSQICTNTSRMSLIFFWRNIFLCTRNLLNMIFLWRNYLVKLQFSLLRKAMNRHFLHGFSHGTRQNHQ